MAAARVILSTEGIFNHWFDMSVASRSALAALNDRFDVSAWVVFREPVSWAMSLYVQTVKNRRARVGTPYSTSEPPEAVITHEYFATRLRYDLFVQDVESVFGEGTVHIMRYESGDILEQARRFLGVDATVLASAGNKNKTLSMLGVELLRRLNSLAIAAEERERIASEIMKLDETLGALGGPIRPSAEFRSKVLALSGDSDCYLEQRFGIGWADCREGATSPPVPQSNREVALSRILRQASRRPRWFASTRPRTGCGEIRRRAR
jgi:hypothetical protein